MLRALLLRSPLVKGATPLAVPTLVLKIKPPPTLPYCVSDTRQIISSLQQDATTPTATLTSTNADTLPEQKMELEGGLIHHHGHFDTLSTLDDHLQAVVKRQACRPLDDADEHDSNSQHTEPRQR